MENKDKSALSQCRSVYRPMHSIPLLGGSVVGVVVVGVVAVVNIVSDEQLVMERRTLMFFCAFGISPQKSDTC